MKSKMDINHLARLARLKLAEEEKQKLTKDLAAILHYVDKLKDSKVDEEISFNQPKEIEAVREDAVREREAGEKEKLLGLVPSVKNGYVKVRRIL